MNWVVSWLIGKDPDTRKVWGQEEEGSTENEMVGWHHWLNGHESEQTLKDSEGHGSLACCSLWGCRVECDFVTEEHWPNSTIPHHGGKRRYSHHLDGHDWATEKQQNVLYIHIKYVHNIYMIWGTQSSVLVSWGHRTNKVRSLNTDPSRTMSPVWNFWSLWCEISGYHLLFTIKDDTWQSSSSCD